MLLATRLILRPTVVVDVVCVHRQPGAVSCPSCDQLADILDLHLLTRPQNNLLCAAMGDGGRQVDLNLDDVLQRYDIVQHVNESRRGAKTLDLLQISTADDSLLSQCTRRASATTSTSSVSSTR